MKLGNFRRLFKTDFKEEFQGLIDQLSNTLNSSFESIFQLTNKNISLKDNISCTLKTIQISVDDSGTPKSSITISLDSSNKVQGLTILKIDNLTNSTSYTSSGVNISFTITNDGVRIDNIKGLIASNNYQINLVIFQD